MRRKDYPNPTFLTKAEGIKKTRHTRHVVILAIIALLVLTGVFIHIGASKQQQYEELFPELVGAAQTTRASEETEETESSETSATDETAEETQTTQTEEILAPVIAATETTEETAAEETAETAETSQNNAADVFTESEPFYFRDSYPLQTITHEQRDVLLDDLKQNVLDYVNANTSERICFRYMNLDTDESTGVNDLEPIVPAGAFALPIELTFWNRAAAGYTSANYIVTYDGSSVSGNSSGITSTYKSGKMFYLRTLAYLAIAENDDYALSVILQKAGGEETVWNYLQTISAYINYTENSVYTDYSGTLMRGTRRTSCYDMTAYARKLYFSYISEPDNYQMLINDLYNSQTASAFKTAFGEDAAVLHVSGRNETYHAYTDIAIIDASEPIILIVYCECSSLDRAQTIQADLTGYVAQYLEACHS